MTKYQMAYELLKAGKPIYYYFMEELTKEEIKHEHEKIFKNTKNGK